MSEGVRGWAAGWWFGFGGLLGLLARPGLWVCVAGTLGAHCVAEFMRMWLASVAGCAAKGARAWPTSMSPCAPLPACLPACSGSAGPAAASQRAARWLQPQPPAARRRGRTRGRLAAATPAAAAAMAAAVQRTMRAWPQVGPCPHSARRRQPGSPAPGWLACRHCTQGTHCKQAMHVCMARHAASRPHACCLLPASLQRTWGVRSRTLS